MPKRKRTENDAIVEVVRLTMIAIVLITALLMGVPITVDMLVF